MPEARSNVMIQMPIGLKLQLEQHCEELKTPVSGFIRKLIADELDYKLSPTAIGRARKYATIEERIAEQKKRDKRRKDLTKKLLAMYAAGEISLDDVVNEVDGTAEAV